MTFRSAETQEESTLASKEVVWDGVGGTTVWGRHFSGCGDGEEHERAIKQSCRDLLFAASAAC